MIATVIDTIVYSGRNYKLRFYNLNQLGFSMNVVNDNEYLLQLRYEASLHMSGNVMANISKHTFTHLSINPTLNVNIRGHLRRQGT